MKHRLAVALLLAAMSMSVVFAAAPEAPRNLTATIAGNSVTLTWQAPSTGSAPLGYVIEAALSPGGAPIAAFLVLERSLVLNAAPNGVYYVRVRSGNAEGISAPSAAVVVSVPGGGGACNSAPNAPTNMSATVAGNAVTLSWLAPSGGCPASAYVVQAGSASGLTDLAVFNVGAATTLAVSAPFGAYFVRVLAVNAFGGSAASNELTVATVDLTGTWFGTSDYFNAPFQFVLTQRGALAFGPYQDQHDRGSGGGPIRGTTIWLDVNFGDTGIRYEGVIVTANRIRGLLRVPSVGRTYTFEMTR